MAPVLYPVRERLARDLDDNLRSATDFFNTLFWGKPDRVAVQVWIKSGKPVTWFLDDLDSCAKVSVNAGPQRDVYVGCGLGVAAQEKPQRTRLKADEVCGIPGTWADIDVNGGPEDKKNAAPTIEAAIELANSILEPTIVIHSGYGLQAWWLFDEGVWIFHDVAERERAKRLVGGFQGALRASAQRLGWRLDSTQDLSRVLRVPGTYNHKGGEPAPTRTLSLGERRYSVDEIAEYCQGYSASAIAESNGHTPLVIESGGNLDHRVTELLVDEPDFSALWKMGSAASVGSDKSLSGYEYAIAKWLCRAGLTDQSVCDALVAFRKKHDPGDPKNKLRPERLTLTIRKAGQSIQHELVDELEKRETEDAVETMEAVARGIEEPNEAKVMSAFNRIIGGPAIARVIQFSHDPRFAKYVIELEDGTECVIGNFSSISNQRMFRDLYATMTRHYPKRVGDKAWHGAVQALLKTVTLVEDKMDSAAGLLGEWVDDYMESAHSTDRNGACQSGHPFYQNGYAYLSLAGLLMYIRRNGERVDRSQLKADLRVSGYEPRKVGFRTSDSRQSSRMYWTNDPTEPRLGRPPVVPDPLSMEKNEGDSALGLDG